MRWLQSREFLLFIVSSILTVILYATVDLVLGFQPIPQLPYLTHHYAELFSLFILGYSIGKWNLRLRWRIPSIILLFIGTEIIVITLNIVSFPALVWEHRIVIVSGMLPINIHLIIGFAIAILTSPKTGKDRVLKGNSLSNR